MKMWKANVFNNKTVTHCTTALQWALDCHINNVEYEYNPFSTMVLPSNTMVLLKYVW